MNESKILRTACDSKWYAHAYSEYLADVAQTTSNLIASLQAALSLESIDDATARDILNSHGIDPEARFIIGKYGSTNVLSLMIRSFLETDSVDENAKSISYPVEELFSLIRGAWTQCVISSKAFESYASDAKDTIARVSKFIQDVQANFQIDDTVRDTVAYYQSMINTSPQVSDFVDKFVRATGVEEADTSDNPMAYANSDVYKYTGNTPGVSLDFSAVNKAVSSTVSVAAKAIKGVFSVVGKGVSWLFNKAKRYVVDTVVDPAVCEYVGDDENNEGYIDGFAWFGSFIPSVQHSYFNTGAQIAEVFDGFYDQYAEQWIKIKLKVGEFLFKIFSGSNAWQCYFKPVAVDVDYFKDNYHGKTIEPSYQQNNHKESLSGYNYWLSSVMECIQPVTKDATKDQIYRGLAFSTHLASSIAMFAFLETYAIIYGSNAIDVDSGNSILDDLSKFYTFEPALQSDAVTNAKMLLAAAGDPTNTNNVDHYISWNKIIGVSLHDSIPHYSIRTMMTSIIAIWALCRTERKLNPADYTFVPYSNNHTSFSPSSWRIKSDEQIAETRDKFIERAIIAAVVVAAVVFIGATVIKISKNAFFKRQQALGQLENKMWSGQALSLAERKKYIRYNRRQNASRWLSNGLSDPSSSLLNNSQSIIQLIQG